MEFVSIFSYFHIRAANIIKNKVSTPVPSVPTSQILSHLAVSQKSSNLSAKKFKIFEVFFSRDTLNLKAELLARLSRLPQCDLSQCRCALDEEDGEDDDGDGPDNANNSRLVFYSVRRDPGWFSLDLDPQIVPGSFFLQCCGSGLV